LNAWTVGLRRTDGLKIGDISITYCLICTSLSESVTIISPIVVKLRGFVVFLKLRYEAATYPTHIIPQTGFKHKFAVVAEPVKNANVFEHDIPLSVVTARWIDRKVSL
jgi:hypothetical protein